MATREATFTLALHKIPLQRDGTAVAVYMYVCTISRVSSLYLESREKGIFESRSYHFPSRFLSIRFSSVTAYILHTFDSKKEKNVAHPYLFYLNLSCVVVSSGSLSQSSRVFPFNPYHSYTLSTTDLIFLLALRMALSPDLVYNPSRNTCYRVQGSSKLVPPTVVQEKSSY